MRQTLSTVEEAALSGARLHFVAQGLTAQPLHIRTAGVGRKMLLTSTYVDGNILFGAQLSKEGCFDQ